jgi:hypothetical protein
MGIMQEKETPHKSSIGTVAFFHLASSQGLSCGNLVMTRRPEVLKPHLVACADGRVDESRVSVHIHLDWFQPSVQVDVLMDLVDECLGIGISRFSQTLTIERSSSSR